METCKAQTQKHIRPKVRSRRQPRITNQTRPPPTPPCPAPPPDERQDDVNLDDLLESTRRRISELSVKSKSSLSPTTIEKNKSTAQKKTKATVLSVSQSLEHPQGILRKGKYNPSNDNNTPSTIIPSTHPSPPPTSSKPSTKPFLKDFVVERRHPRPPTPTAVVTPPSSSSTTVDGYTPRTTTATTTSTKKTEKIRSVPELIAEHDALTRDLSRWGCVDNKPTKHDDDDDHQLTNSSNDDDESPEMTLEADVTFTCMSEQEFNETVALEQSLALHNISADDDDDSDVQRTNNNINNNEDITNEPSSSQRQNPFFGRILFSDDNTDDDDDDDDDFDIFLDTTSDDDTISSPPALPPPPPRPFILLWTALSSWVTPSTIVAISPHAITVEPYDTAPSSLSRRDGILALLGLHLPRWLTALSSSSSSDGDASLSETTVTRRWRRLVDSFDVTRPVTLEGDLWFVMTGILMGVVMGEDWAGKVCGVVREEGGGLLSVEECRYLVTEAIASLGRGSA